MAMLLCPNLEGSDPVRRREALKFEATVGEARAQSKLGDLYRIGDELTEQDFAEAIRWYNLAAAQGDPDAQNNLGSMYLNGLGVAKDAVEAAMWYRRAADQGLAVAQFNLALRYLHGDGVEQDDHEAVRWVLLATKQGHVEAISELGTLCRFGRGVPQDLAAASQLHVLAAQSGDPVALGNLCDYRKDLERIALGGNPTASLSLGTMYDKGLAVERDQATALAWLAWGKARRCARDEATRTELLAKYKELATGTENLIRRRAAHLLKHMRSVRRAMRPKPSLPIMDMTDESDGMGFMLIGVTRATSKKPAPKS